MGTLAITYFNVMSLHDYQWVIFSLPYRLVIKAYRQPGIYFKISLPFPPNHSSNLNISNQGKWGGDHGQGVIITSLGQF